MTNENTHHTNESDQRFESSPLMAVYNAEPPQPEQTARFYWQEPWHEQAAEAANGAVQAAFEN
jgi:hypothetical protein